MRADRHFDEHLPAKAPFHVLDEPSPSLSIELSISLLEQVVEEGQLLFLLSLAGLNPFSAFFRLVFSHGPFFKIQPRVLPHFVSRQKCGRKACVADESGIILNERVFGLFELIKLAELFLPICGRHPEQFIKVLLEACVEAQVSGQRLTNGKKVGARLQKARALRPERSPRMR